MDQSRGAATGSKLPELTKRAILMLKAANPEWGCQRISDMLLRGPALPASAGAVARVLHEAGYALEEVTTRPHPDKVRHFERAKPNQLWQTDLFTFVLKRQNRRIYLVAFMLEKRGIKQVVAKPRRPQTLGKIERFWGTLWRECVESAVFIDLGDAQKRIGLFIDHYNFQRPHQGIDGLTPADRYFGAAEEVKRTLAVRVAANALELARQGLPKAPFYLTGQVGGQGFSVHAEGERVIMTNVAGERREVELTPPPVAAVA